MIPGLNVSAAHASDISPLYRYYNSTTGDHFYTTDLRELGKGKDGYKPERILRDVFSPNVALEPFHYIDTGMAQ
jgi:hypothetical protein